MSKGLRLSEKWFNRGLWLVAVVFAGFLVGLGSLIVGDLPQVEAERSVQDFVAQPAGREAEARVKAAQAAQDEANIALDQARLKAQSATSDTQSASDAFRDWVATRRATAQPDQDTELVARTRALEALRQAERVAKAAVERQEQAMLDAQQARAKAQTDLKALTEPAEQRFAAELRSAELRVFGLRLAITLPLLGLAAWLWKKKRHGKDWPFVWGFIFFALFTFFVELVPYLPSYGGYIRYLVGIVLTVVVGRQAITALQKYLERQKAAEAMPDARRREDLSYDTALARLGKGVCPGCERSVDFKNEKIDFCPHCGIGLFDRCGHCATRKSAFTKFCHACGTHNVATARPAPEPVAAVRPDPSAGLVMPPRAGAQGAV